MTDFLWAEKYRPRRVQDCILPKRLKDVFQQYVDNREIPNLILTGPPGTGKTTVAMAMAEESGSDWYKINSSDESGIDTFRTKIKQYASAMSLTGTRRVLILDEADYLNPQSTQPALRGAIEEFASNCSFVFTCNYKDRLIPALQSRAPAIDFKLTPDERKEMAEQFFKAVCKILGSEGVTFEKKVVAEVVKKYFPDYRRTLGELQKFANQGGGTIDESILTQVKDVNLHALVAALKDKNFGEVRKWAGQNSDADMSKIFRQLYDAAYSTLKPESIPQAVVILADYQYKAAFAADQELNVVACLVSLMVECEWQ